MAGTGKKADQKKPSIWKDTKYFGRHGFYSRYKKLRAINIFYIEQHFEMLSKDGKIKKEADFHVINLKDLKADKLLGSGTVTRKYKIIAMQVSEPAKAKLAEKGGVVEIKLPKAIKVIAEADKKQMVKE
jgi:ribosomal protein L15